MPSKKTTTYFDKYPWIRRRAQINANPDVVGEECFEVACDMTFLNRPMGPRGQNKVLRGIWLKIKAPKPEVEATYGGEEKRLAPRRVGPIMSSGPVVDVLLVIANQSEKSTIGGILLDLNTYCPTPPVDLNQVEAVVATTTNHGTVGTITIALVGNNSLAQILETYRSSQELSPL